MDRDFQTKSAVLLKTKFGTVSASNFEADHLESEDCQREVDLEGGPFCLVPDELDIPF